MFSYELLEKVLKYVNNEIDIEQLNDWLVPRLPNFLSSLDTPDAIVADAIELGLAEMSDGIRTEDEFRSLLQDVIREHRAVLDFSPVDQRSQLDMTKSSNSISSPTILSHSPVPTLM